MAKWIDIGPATDYPPNSPRPAQAENVPLVVFNIEGLLLAIANVCPHAGLPLDQGCLQGKSLTCPFHGYTYNVETGRNVDFPNEEPPVRTFPVRTTEADRVEVDIDMHAGARA